MRYSNLNSELDESFSAESQLHTDIKTTLIVIRISSHDIQIYIQLDESFFIESRL